MPDKPNILILHADQHRWDCLGLAGNAEVRTPHIDALAGDGIHYTNSFCPFPICTPSRYSLLSGQYVHQHRGYSNQSTPQPGTPFFPALLKEAGYKTKAVGKMHFTPTYLDVGFDEMKLAEQCGPGRWDDDYHRYLQDLDLADINDIEDQVNEYRRQSREEYRQLRGALASNLPEAHYPSTWIGDRAIESISTWEGTGNLLMAGFIKPHHPSDPPKPWDGRYDPDLISLLPGWTEDCFAHDLDYNAGFFRHDEFTPLLMRRLTAYYYALISLVDHQVGRIISVLKDRGQYEDTLIIYTSDHGDYRGYHHLNGKCGYLYEPLMRVPLIIKYPGQTGASRRDERLNNNIDIAPTILRQADCAVPESMPGLDLAAEGNGHEIVLAEYHHGPLYMARDHRHKLILCDGDQPSLFYDLEKDPRELNNRFEDPACRDSVAALTAAIREWQGPDAKSTNHVDQDAPIIDQPNVPDRNDDHRKAIQAYFQRKWQEARR